MKTVDNITAACFRRGSQMINCKLMDAICSASFHLKDSGFKNCSQ
jgi:hypothetical protein